MKTVVHHTGHSTFNLYVHPVFVTKYHRKIFTAQILTELKIIFATVCCQLEASLIEFDGAEDHVHLLVLYSPKLSRAELVFRLKGVSSRIMRSGQYPTITKALWGNALFDPSYVASSFGGAPISII